MWIDVHGEEQWEASALDVLALSTRLPLGVTIERTCNNL